MRVVATQNISTVLCVSLFVDSSYVKPSAHLDKHSLVSLKRGYLVASTGVLPIVGGDCRTSYLGCTGLDTGKKSQWVVRSHN